MGRLNSEKYVKGLYFASVIVLSLIMTRSLVFSEEDHDRAKILRDHGEIKPLAEILQKAVQKQRGTMIEVELEEEEGRIIYELEFLDDEGQVWEIKYDAKTGDWLSSEEEK